MTEETIPAAEEQPAETTPAELDVQTPAEVQAPQGTEIEPGQKPSKALSIYAVISLVAGIGAYVWFIAMIKPHPWLALILSPIISLLAVISGHKARHQIRHYIGVMKGKKLANYGLLLGYFLILVGVAIIVLVLTGVISAITAIFGL